MRGLIFSFVAVGMTAFFITSPPQGFSETAASPSQPAKTDVKVETPKVEAPAESEKNANVEKVAEKKEAVGSTFGLLVSKEAAPTQSSKPEPVREEPPSPALVDQLVIEEKPVETKEEPPAEKKKMVTKTISGEVGAKGANGIALVYEKNERKRSSKEMWFPFETELKLERYKSKADISDGDSVKLTYEEAEDGSKRVLKGITLQKKAPKEDEEGSDG